MKTLKTATVIAALALLAATAAKADNYTVKMTRAIPGDKKSACWVTTTIVRSSTDTIWLTPPDGWAPTYNNAGAHRAVPWGPLAEGTAIKKTGDGDGDPHILGAFYYDQDTGWTFYYDGGPNGGSGAPQGITINFVNNYTNVTTSYTVNIPFWTGSVNFVGNEVAGYNVTSYYVNVAQIAAAGTNMPAPPQSVAPAKAQK